MQEYGLDKFEFQVIAEVEPCSLKEKEQEFIETLKPIYNDKNAYGFDIERRKETHRKASNKYNKSDKRKKANKKYDSQLCFYNGETLTLHALYMRFKRKGIIHPTAEAKKYLL